MKQVIFNNLVFTRDEKTGYYLCAKTINGKRPRLHRYIWYYYNGEIPKGCDIHHIDKNKDNNDIRNLQLLKSSEHKKLHGEDGDGTAGKSKEWLVKNLNEKARPKAIEWHKSEEGRKWHKEHYKQHPFKHEERELVCEHCGKTYKAMYNSLNRFCSNNCKSAYRRKSGVDNEQRKCVVCGTEFTANKYTKKQTCGRSCASKIAYQNREKRCV